MAAPTSVYPALKKYVVFQVVVLAIYKLTLSVALTLFMVWPSSACCAGDEVEADKLLIRWYGNGVDAPSLSREAYDSDFVRAPKEVRIWRGAIGSETWLLLSVRKSGQFRFGGKVWRITDDDWSRAVISHAANLVVASGPSLRAAPAVTLLKDFSTRYVFIAGQVRSEVFYLLFEGDLRLEKLVENAGGFDRYAARELVILRGKEVLVVRWKSDPKWKDVRVHAGDLVFVGTHEIF